jgi:hypothetical protein
VRSRAKANVSYASAKRFASIFSVAARRSLRFRPPFGMNKVTFNHAPILSSALFAHFGTRGNGIETFGYV